MEFRWNSEDEKLAITGADEDIYPRIGLQSRAKPLSGHVDGKSFCGKEVYIDLRRTYDATPGTCNRGDLEDFLGKGLNDYPGVGWSVFWHAESMRAGHRDEAYEDGFRAVVAFRTIEFSIRPVGDPRPSGFVSGHDVPRLLISRDDIKHILNEVLVRFPSTQEFDLSRLGGTCQAIQPNDKQKKDAVPQIPFGWRIARLSQERIVTSVHRWRNDHCKEPGKNYAGLIQIYSQFYMDHGPGTQMPPPVVNPEARLRLQRKRKSWRSSTSPEPGMSRKRQGQDSVSSLRSGSDLSPTSGVTRGMSSLAIVAPDSTYGPWAASYQQSIQGYRQPDPDRAPRQRFYGDDIPESDLDRSRGIGPIPGSIQHQLQQQAMRPPFQGPGVPRMPGVQSMLRGAPPPTTFHPPGYPLPPMSSGQYGRPPGHHGAFRNESTAATPQGRASPQPPYQYPRGGSTSRGGGPFQGPGIARGSYQSGPQATQEQGGWPGRGGGRGAPPGLIRPREENPGGYQEDYEEGYEGEYQEGFQPSIHWQYGRGRGGPSRG